MLRKIYVHVDHFNPETAYVSDKKLKGYDYIDEYDGKQRYILYQWMDEGGTVMASGNTLDELYQETHDMFRDWEVDNPDWGYPTNYKKLAEWVKGTYVDCDSNYAWVIFDLQEKKQLAGPDNDDSMEWREEE